MTLRSRPSGTRPRTWEGHSRRNAYLNLAFGFVVLIALLLLALAVGVSWYGEHLASAGSVNGQSISKDQLRTREAIDAFRYDYALRRLRTLLAAEHIDANDAQARQALIQQQQQQATAISLERLIDSRIMTDLAQQRGITVSDAEIDAQMTKEATIPELRHAWLIAVEPTLAAGETAPTDAEKAAAKAKADAALADLKAGKAWDTVAKAVSTDASKDKAGDQGFIDDQSALDAPLVKALFKVAANAPTDVIEGADGTYRIGRVTDIAAPVTDGTFTTQVTDWGVKLDDYRAAVRIDVVRTKLNDAIVAEASKPGVQRKVQEIYLAADQNGADELTGAVRIRHILYSPNDDAQGATTLADSDPAWKVAEDAARAAYEKVKADISLFDGLARNDNDDSGSTSTGGRYWFTKDSGLDPAFGEAIFKAGLQPGQLLEPVRSSFGWHVIQILHFAPDSAWIAKLKADADGGADFATLARDNSDGAEASKGGDLGWVYKGEKSKEIEAAIFAAPVGKASDPLTIDGDGRYLFKVTAEENRALDPEQLANVEQTAFSNWYTQQKATYTITREGASSTGGTAG